MSRRGVLEVYPELLEMKPSERNAVLRHLRPYFEQRALESLALLPMEQQREALADLLFETAVAKARLELLQARLREDFSTSAMPEVEADVRVVFAKEIEAAPADQREYLVSYITNHMFPYRFSDIYPDPRIQAISKRTLLAQALAAAPGAEKHPASIQPVAPAQLPTAAQPNLPQVPQQGGLQAGMPQGGINQTTPDAAAQAAAQAAAPPPAQAAAQAAGPAAAQESWRFWTPQFYSNDSGLPLRMTLFVIGALGAFLLLVVGVRAIASRSTSPPGVAMPPAVQGAMPGAMQGAMPGAMPPAVPGPAIVQ